MQATPASAAASMPSANGKNASDPSAAPRALPPARSAAMRTESTRFVCPMPMPTVTSRWASTIALDFTCLTTSQANCSASISSGVGERRGRRGIHWMRQCDDAPEGADGIGVTRAAVGVEHLGRARHAAWVGVLDDHGGGGTTRTARVFLHRLERGGTVEQVVVGQLLP